MGRGSCQFISCSAAPRALSMEKCRNISALPTNTTRHFETLSVDSIGCNARRLKCVPRHREVGEWVVEIGFQENKHWSHAVLFVDRIVLDA